MSKDTLGLHLALSANLTNDSAIWRKVSGVSELIIWCNSTPFMWNLLKNPGVSNIRTFCGKVLVTWYRVEALEVAGFRLLMLTFNFHIMDILLEFII